MAFNGLVARVGSLLNSDVSVEDSMPCKSDILSVRECTKSSSMEKCEGLRLDLMHCVTKYYVDTTEKVRLQIGIANYNEYVKELETKHGKEKAADIITEPTEKLKTVKAAQMIHRLQNNQHPEGAPTTKADLAVWTEADQTRLEMGEKAYWDSVKVFGAEFGAEAADRLFGISKEAAKVSAAVERLAPGKNPYSMKMFDEILEPVRAKAPENATLEELAAAVKKVYPNKKALESKLA